MQLAKYPHVLYAKPSNKVYVLLILVMCETYETHGMHFPKKNLEANKKYVVFRGIRRISLRLKLQTNQVFVIKSIFFWRSEFLRHSLRRKCFRFVSE